MRAMLSREDMARRLAQELDRELGHRLANAVTDIDMAGSLVESDPSAVRAGLTQLRAELQQGLARLRWLVEGLRPPTLLNDLGLGPSLARYAQRFAGQSGLTVHTDSLADFTRRLPATAELAIFRIVQEALGNVQQHAHATHIALGVERTPDGLAFFVEDDGRGFDAQQPARSLGLMDMQGRARAVGGTLQILSRAGAGTKVIVRVPDHGSEQGLASW